MHVDTFIGKLEIFEKLKLSCLSNWYVSLILSDQVMYIFNIRPNIWLKYLVSWIPAIAIP